MRLNFLSLIILVAIVGGAVGGAYGAGMVAGRMSTAAAATQATAAAPLATPGASTGMGGQGSFGRGLTGTVEKVEGNTLTVSSPTGGSTQVILGQDTAIQKTASASREELRPGVRVMVVPSQQQGPGGAVVPTAIQIVTGEGAAPSQTPRARPQGSPTSAP